MIYKNSKIGATENVTIAEFGKGDIIVSPAWHEETKCHQVVLINDVGGEIGREHQLNGISTEKTGVDIILSFPNIESIDVVIEILNATRNNILNDKKPIIK